jgi:hypothetical protein
MPDQTSPLTDDELRQLKEQFGKVFADTFGDGPDENAASNLADLRDQVLFLVLPYVKKATDAWAAKSEEEKDAITKRLSEVIVLYIIDRFARRSFVRLGFGTKRDYKDVRTLVSRVIVASYLVPRGWKRSFGNEA